MSTEELFGRIVLRFGGLIVFVLILKALANAFTKRVLPVWRGKLGEGAVNLRIKIKLDPNIYHSISDIMLPTPEATTQIDHIIVSRYGVFVVETKNYKGWIFGNEKSKVWTQSIFGKKHKFQNPLRQNYRHTKTLSELIGISMEYLKSVVVFTGESTFETEMPANVMTIRQLDEHILSFQESVIRDEQVVEIITTIEKWASTVTEEQKNSHVKNLKRDKVPVSADSTAPACPRCGDPMVLRTNRKDKSSFWGCPGYPQCRGTRKAA